MNVDKNDIELILPFKAEFVSIARLTSSGVANRVGFDIEGIEDIKVAISEVCNKLVKAGSQIATSYKIVFRIGDRRLDIIFDCPDKSLKCVFDEENDALGLSIINALMDDVELCPDKDFLLAMSKSIEENS
ncbi:anti-sigma regulatory factor [Clostridium thermosuccinogenes]|uniref:Anti-sigma regulatory factor n=1 Tax=Clostridium thermosuccinogenes TaxID=84032 RepID=A0A2K2FDL5_9CLOT|nr:anti-sigma regulatory factor [Pseudoclostridium thermosuccinogenes]AUS98153.1 anti-sigma regulatory factor [Pseudoclostridium thermosuccinogenes]PNT91191.1 anti-sigma regulatory factor [Pseudoclostridium thermosuccinogenes]PNT96869.1 anti-sigma regulatory factor [Pseudoclostridium thermosuccinogenes]PNT98679.1 anti-sigma regulatory factor [Pseudoclostridium thermosuccinogenes]